MSTLRSRRLSRTVAAFALVVAGLSCAASALAAPAKRPAAANRPAAPAAPVAAAEAPAPAPARDLWREARDLASRGEPDSALALIRPVVSRDTAAFDLRWLEAGLTGDAGRSAEAVQLYERLSAAFPGRAAELLGDLGKERLRSDDPRGASRDLRAWLAEHVDDESARRRLALALARSDSLDAALMAYAALLAEHPEDTELALDRARVLGWMGRHRQAIVAYAAVLEREPQLESAELGLAKNENWLGRHRRATRRLEALVGRGNADAETWKALAFARYWDDDPDGALLALESHRALEPEDREAKDLAARIAREHASNVELGHGFGQDSDDLTVSSPSVQVSWPLARNAAANVGWRQDLTEDGVGTNDVMQLTAGVRYRFAPALTTYATGSTLTWKNGPGATRGGEAGIVLRPMDHVRFEVVAGREPVLTRVSLERGISLLSWISTADWDVWPRVALHADARAGSYSDGNRSERTSASGRWQVLDAHRWDVTGLLGVEQLNVHADLDHGYYDPDFHREWGPGVEVEWHPAARWAVRGTGKTGWQRDKDSVAELFYGLSGRARWRPTEDWDVAIEGGKGDSNLQSAAGYRRSWVHFSVSRAF